MSTKIPLNRLLIEWNTGYHDGGFRLSHVDHDNQTTHLHQSAGAAFGRWYEMSSDDPLLEAWLWFTICNVLNDGVDPALVWRELDARLDCPPGLAKINLMQWGMA